MASQYMYVRRITSKTSMLSRDQGIMPDKLMAYSDVSVRAREFIISTYHNLPNVLLVTSLLLGAIQGNLSMLWVAIGMIINMFVILGSQELLGLLFPLWAQVHQPSSKTCSLFQDILGPPTTIVAPSYWFASTTYFVVFVLYNALQVANRPSAPGANSKKVDIRVAFTMSVIILSIFFFCLLMLRGLTGCETWLGSSLGVLFGSAVAIFYWHILNFCHSGIPPDILNVVTALAPTKTDDKTPVICTA
jgi:hypothetical protein